MVHNVTLTVPRVSIVIAAYNCQDTIAAAVRSCLDQTYPNTEVVVVNDGSTDSTADVLASFGSRIRVVTQHNGGLAAARNAGTRAATGEFIAWMDADDLATPDRAAVEAAVLQLDSNLAVVSSDFTAFVDEAVDFDPSHISSYYNAFSRLGGAARIYEQVSTFQLPDGARPVRRGHVYEQLLWGNFVHPPTVMARREWLERAGPFDDSLRYSSDYDLLLRLAHIGEFAFVEAPLLRYRRSPTQMSGSASSRIMPFETIRILEKARAADPSLDVRLAALFKRRMAESLVTAAAAIGPTERIKALSLLWAGLRQRFVLKPSLVALIRIALPDAIRRLMTATYRRLFGKKLAYLTTSASTAFAACPDACFSFPPLA